MQRNKSILVLSVILVVLMGYWWGKDNLLTESDGVVEAYGEMVGGMKPSEVKEINVYDGEKELQITRTADGFEMEEYKADDELIDMMLKNALESEGVELVSETNVRHEALGVLDDGNSLTLKSSAHELKMFLGTSTATGRYVRFVGDARVFLVEGLSLNNSSTSVADWVDNTVVEVNIEEIEEIRIQGSELIVLQHRDGQWYKDDQKIEEGSISSFINTLSALETQGLVEDEEINYRIVPSLEIQVISKSGEVELKLYEGEDNALAESSMRNGKYVLSNALLEILDLKSGEVELVTSE